jgi:oxygen-independent coproporphyrinogen-3 oxidase
MKSKANALYIHIPFCRNICTYCDFKKFIYNQKRIDDYFKSLFLDLQQYSHKKYKSIYIGGGTPSCIDYQNLKSLLEHLKTLLDKNYVEGQLSLFSLLDEAAEKKVIEATQAIAEEEKLVETIKTMSETLASKSQSFASKIPILPA